MDSLRSEDTDSLRSKDMDSRRNSKMNLIPEELSVFARAASYIPPESPSTSHRNIYLATFAVQLFMVGMGMTASYSSPASEDMKRPGSRLRGITADEITWIASLPMLAGMFGNALSGYASHTFGRKTTLMFLSVSFTVGWLIVAYAPTVAFIYVGRIISGVSTGMCTVAVPAYVVEISTVEIRGLLSSSVFAAVAVGTFAMTAFGIVLRWTWLAVLTAGVGVAAASALSFMPESPPWLIREGRYAEALRGILFLKGRRHDAMKEMAESVEQLGEEPRSSLPLKELLNPTLYKPLLIAVVLMLNMSFCGFPAMISYSVEIFKSSKNAMDPNVSATIVIMVQIVATVVGSVLMDRAGRKVLYITSGSVMTLSLFIFGTYSYYTTKYDEVRLDHWIWIPEFSFIVYLASFSIGFGSVPFVVIPELVQTAYRSFVMAVAAVSGSLFGFIVIKIFEDMRSAVGIYGIYWTYGMFSLAGTLFYWIFIPETKCMSIHDISKTFTSSNKKLQSQC